MKRKAKKTAKRTGPSQRTAAQRAAIDKRAAHASKMAKRKQRAAQKADTAKPTKKTVMRSIVNAMTPLVAETAGNKGKRTTAAPQTERQLIDAQRLKAFGVSHYSPDAELIDPALIVVGERHRKDFGDLNALAQSINDRGGLIQPIAVKPPRGKPVLIAGERRLRAWALSRFAGQPIPAHFLDVDNIVAGEWDENAQRKDFTHSEAVKIQRALEGVMAKLKAARPAAEKPARGRKASGEAAGRVKDKVGKLTGIGRESLRKAQEVVMAAEADQERYGDLVEQMDRSGSVNAAHKKLNVRKAKAAIAAAPPALPMRLEDCGTVVIDFPHAGEPDADQEQLDAAGRAFRPYPEMSIKTCCAFARDEIAPRLAEDVAVWLWVTNFILVRGYHLHLISALGFKVENTSTMLTWGKDKIGRGQILRDKSEHAILLTRGKVLIDVFGEDPPSTLLLADRRENSRKPAAFYRLAERVTPAKRYASIFSQGGEGEDWDSHGDQVGKYAASAAPSESEGRQAHADGSFAALDQETRDARLLDILDAVETEPDYKLPEAVDQWFSGELAVLVAGKRKLKLTAAGRARRDALLVQFRLTWLEAVEAGNGPQLRELAREYLSGLKLTNGMQAKKLTALGRDRLSELREERDDKAAMALLPDDIGALVALYGETIAKHHAAVLENDQAAAEREEQRLELLIRRANGGTMFGSATDDSPAERLRAENRAPIGEVPMWGQEGIFRIEVEGIAAIVEYDPIGDWFNFHAVDGTKPFISETGFLSEAGGFGGASLGCTVLQQAEAYLREEIAMPLNAGGARREQRGKKNPLPVPEKWFRLPVSWAEHDRDDMPEAGGKDLFGKPVKPTPPDEAKQIDLEEAIAAHGRAPADEDAIAQFENADLYRIPQDVIDAIGRLGGHTITRTIDHEQGEKGHAVATCQCGWQAVADRTLPYSGENVLAPQEEAHWRTVLAAEAAGQGSGEDNKKPAAAEPPLAPDDPGPLPPELVRKPSNAVAAG